MTRVQLGQVQVPHGSGSQSGVRGPPGGRRGSTRGVPMQLNDSLEPNGPLWASNCQS